MSSGKVYRIHARGGYNTFAAWRNASAFLKRMLDNGHTDVRVEVIHAKS